MSKCGCCNEAGHSVTQCTSNIVTSLVVHFTETLPLEDALDFIRYLNTWQLTAMINYLNGPNPRHSKMRKQVKIAVLENKLNHIKHAEDSVSIATPREYNAFATNLYTRLCEEFEPITATTELNVFRSIIRKAVESIIQRYTAYDVVRLVNQHFVWQCLPSGLGCVCRMISVRYINRAFSVLQAEARMAAFSKNHLKKLEIIVNTNKAATFQDTQECQICVDPDNKEFARLNCAHVICTGCVADIAERREKSFIVCPYCREEIKQIEVVNDAEHMLQLELNRL